MKNRSDILIDYLVAKVDYQHLISGDFDKLDVNNAIFDAPILKNSITDQISINEFNEVFGIIPNHTPIGFKRFNDKYLEIVYIDFSNDIVLHNNSTMSNFYKYLSLAYYNMENEINKQINKQ